MCVCGQRSDRQTGFSVGHMTAQGADWLMSFMTFDPAVMTGWYLLCRPSDGLVHSFILSSFFLSCFLALLNCIFSYLVFVDFWLVCSLFSFNFSSLQRLFYWREYWQIIITACVSLNTWSQQKKTNNWLWTAFQKNNIERCTQIEKFVHQSISFSFFFVRGVHLKENHAAACSPPPFTAWALSCVSPHQ